MVTISATGADTYSWNYGTPQVDGSAINDNPTVNTTYVVTGTSLDGCQSTAETTVTVHDMPTIVASADVSICEGMTNYTHGNPAALLQDILARDYFDSQGDLQAIVTKGDNFCKIEELDAVATELESKDWGYWLHILEDPSGQDYLYIGIKNPDFPDVMGPVDAEHMAFIEESKTLTEQGVYRNPFGTRDEEILNGILFDISAQIVSYSHAESNPTARNLQEGCYMVPEESVFISPAGVALKLFGGDLACANPVYRNGGTLLPNGCLGAVFRNDEFVLQYNRHLALVKGNQFLGYALVNEKSEAYSDPVNEYFFYKVQPENVVPITQYLETNIIYYEPDPVLAQLLFKPCRISNNDGSGTLLTSLGDISECFRLKNSASEYDGRFPTSGATLEERIASTMELRNTSFPDDRQQLLTDLANSSGSHFINLSNATFELGYFNDFLQDKLALLHEETGKSFKIVISEKPYPLEQAQLEALAGDVHTGVNPGTNTATLFVHLHKDISVDRSNIRAESYTIHLPQFHFVNNDGIVEQLPPAGLPTLQQQLMQYYAGIRKPYFVVVYKDLPGDNREVSVYDYRDQSEWQLGQVAIYDFLIYRYKQQAPLLTGLIDGQPIYDKTSYQLLDEAIANIDDPSMFHPVERVTNLKERCVQDQAEFYGDDTQRPAFITYFATYVDQTCLYEEYDVVTSVIYPIIDVTSFIPILGAIPDFAGMWIALYRGEYMRASAYGGAVALHFTLGGKYIEPALTAGVRGIISKSKSAVIPKASIVADDIAEQIFENIGSATELNSKQLDYIEQKVAASSDGVLEEALSPTGYKAMEAAKNEKGKNYDQAIDKIFGGAFKATDDILELLRSRFREVSGNSTGTFDDLVDRTATMLNGFHPSALPDESISYILASTDDALALLSKARSFDNADLFIIFNNDLEVDLFASWVKVSPIDPARVDTWKYLAETTDENLKLKRLDEAVLGELLTDLPSIKSFLDEGVDRVRAWEFVFQSPIIRKEITNLENMLEIMDTKFFDAAGIANSVLRDGINTSGSKAKMIERLKDASQEGSSVEEFLDAFSTRGKVVDHKLETIVSQMDDAFSGIDYSGTSSDFNAKWDARQIADTKQDKIIASELLGEARVDQLYEAKGWIRIDVDGIPPGKQGKFDRIYQGPDGELHVIEAKGGSIHFGSRVTASGQVAQQGTTEYLNDIILSLKNKLGPDHPLNIRIEDAIEDNKLKYILVSQKTTLKSSFDVKLFPEL